MSTGYIIYITLSHFNLVETTFTSNRAYFANYYFNVITVNSSSFNITNSMFNKNHASAGSAVIGVKNVENFVSIHNCTFIDNCCGCAVWVWNVGGFLDMSNITLSNNLAPDGVMRVTEGAIHITDIYFHHNQGSFYAIGCNVTFSGYNRFSSNVEPYYGSNNSMFVEPSGAVTCYHSKVMFAGMTRLFNNKGQRGGAVLAIDSTIQIYGDTQVGSNKVTGGGNGGGFYLRQSKLEIKGNCTIFRNTAFRGGGIYSSGSIINVYIPGFLHLIHNIGCTGGGAYLETDSGLNILKINDPSQYINLTSVTFANNHADYGGAVYVADNTTSVACSVKILCFIQTLSTDLAGSSDTKNTFFVGNSATIGGSNLYGGLLDRCVQSLFAGMDHYVHHFSCCHNNRC